MDAQESGAAEQVCYRAGILPFRGRNSTGFIQRETGNPEVEDGSFFIISLLVYFDRIELSSVPHLCCTWGSSPHSSWCCSSHQDPLPRSSTQQVEHLNHSSGTRESQFPVTHRCPSLPAPQFCGSLWSPGGPMAPPASGRAVLLPVQQLCSFV